jgi:lipoate-protein ligase B
MIHSCGLKGVEIVSLSSLLCRSIPLEEAKKKTISSFEDVFTLENKQIYLTDLLALLSSYAPSV